MVDIMPGPLGDEDRRAKLAMLEAARRRQLSSRIGRSDPLVLLPDASEKVKEAGQRVIKDTAEFFTKAGERIVDTALSRPPALRELISSNEEFEHEIEIYAIALKKSQIEWQKEAGNIIGDILKIGHDAAELYEA